MSQKQAVERVAFERWQGHPTDIYTVRVGPATCEISRRQNKLRLSIFGRVTDHPLLGGASFRYEADWGALQVADLHLEGFTEFKLVWDDRFEEKGAKATSYIPTTTQTEYVSVGTAIAAAPPNQVAWSDFNANTWPMDTASVWTIDTSVKAHYRAPEEQNALEEKWGKVRDDIRGVQYWGRTLSQEELNKLTSPAAERSRKLLLLAP